MKIVPLKILVGACFAIVRFLSGLLPYQIYRCLKILDKPEEPGTTNKVKNSGNQEKEKEELVQKRKDLVESAFLPFQSFSGGALFATCLLHMVPDVNLAVTDLKSFGLLDSDYPFSQLIVSSGFFLVYFVEEISQYILCVLEQESKRDFDVDEEEHKQENKGNCKQVNKEDSKLENKEDSKLENKDDCPERPKSRKIYVKSGSVIKRKHGLSYELDFCQKDSPEKLQSSLDVEKQNANNLQKSKVAPFSAIREQERQNSTLVENDRNYRQNTTENLSTPRGCSRGRPLTPFEEQLELNQLIETQGKSQQQILRYILIVLALSSYAILEGIAIGLQRSLANTWYLLGALSIHSASNLFSIGLDLVKSKTKIRTIIIHVFILSIASPLGVYIGLAASLTHSHITKGESAALVVLEGLSAGTILYITFFEVLNREKDLRVHRFKRAVCIIAGFGLLAYLEYAEVTK